MYCKRILMIIIGIAMAVSVNAQSVETVAEVDVHSLDLFNAGQWKTLLVYGKEKIASGVDFPLLRMRTGYAAYMLGNFSQSLIEYKQVLDADPANATARYYVYLDNLYLNNTTAARFYAAKLPAETRVHEKIPPVKIASLQTEFSLKMPTDSFRGNAQYARVGVNLNLGYKFELQQSVAIYNQVINELKLNPNPYLPPFLQPIQNPTHINIQQREYYAKLIYAATGKISLVGGFHYLYTPYNTLKYSNTILFGGIRYATPYVQVAATAHAANIANRSFNQYDGSIKVLPFGNMKLYSITGAAYNDTTFTASEILGYGISKKIWLEGNITFGKFTSLFENDNLYVFNDIDQKQIKAGGSIYASLSKNLLLTLNYTFEKKLRFATRSNNFYQHSINAGLTWKF